MQLNLLFSRRQGEDQNFFVSDYSHQRAVVRKSNASVVFAFRVSWMPFVFKEFLAIARAKHFYTKLIGEVSVQQLMEDRLMTFINREPCSVVVQDDVREGQFWKIVDLPALL